MYEPEEIISLYNSGLSSVKIANKFNVSVGTITYLLSKYKIKMRSNKENSRLFTVNHNIFNLIDTPEKAYWLGFLYADGYICADRDLLGISLSSLDENHLKKLLIFLDSDYQIKKYQNKSAYSSKEIESFYSRVIITSEQIKSDLIKHGMCINKTLILKEPVLDEYLNCHFIRGYFDGDGTLTYGSKVNGKQDYNLKITGTESILTYIKKHFNKENLSLYHKKGTDPNVLTLTIGGKIQLKRILDYMYNGSTVHLDRKYERYIEFNNVVLGSNS